MNLKGIDFTPKAKRLDFDTEIKPFESSNSDLNDFLLNDAKKDVIDFYTRNKFEFLTSEDENDDTRLMYLDLNSIQ